jgi:glutathione S-transferase
VGKLGEAGAPLGPRINSEINNVLDYLEAALEGRDFIMGDDLSAADFMLIFIAEIAQSSGRLKERPNLSGYVARIQKRPAYIRALKAGGPYSFAATPSN